LFIANAHSVQQRLRDVHDELRKELEGVHRLAVAIYDAESDELKTFVHSTDGISPFRHLTRRLDSVPSLAALAENGEDRVIADINDLPAAGEHTIILKDRGYRSSYTTPFYDRGRLFGFVFFDSCLPNYFDGPRLRHAMLYAHLIALMVIDAMRPVYVLRSAVDVARAFGHFRDRETGVHLDRMAHYARLIAQVLAGSEAFNDEFVEFVFIFAPLHDIGKIAVADQILLKPGRLSPAEFDIMKRHVSEGVEMVETIVASFGIDAAQHVEILRNIVRYHHEWYDGSGYLAGLAGDAIPIEARIVSVADVFDALTTHRPYKEAYSNSEAFAFLSRSILRQFDPACVAAMIANRDAIEAIQDRFRAKTGLHEAYRTDL
jgi:HD-GYP domain-containing protein (c-di-GMP phosphodiesterase class II)